MEQKSKQDGEVKEQVTEKPSEPVSKPSPEEKKTSRTYSEAEWRKMQSMKDKAEAEKLRYEKEVTELRKQTEEQRLAQRRKEIADLEGEPDEQAKVKRKHQLEDEVNKLQELKAKEEGAVQRKYDQALELAAQHDLSIADARDLMAAGTPREMELMAQIKVAEKEKTPKEVSGFKPDSATSDAGRDSDDIFIQKWNSGDEPATKENLARAQKILKER